MDFSRVFLSCPVYDDLSEALFTKMSSTDPTFFWLDDYENMSCAFFVGANFPAQAESLV